MVCAGGERGQLGEFGLCPPERVGEGGAGLLNGGLGGGEELFYPEEFGELDLEAPLDVPEEDQLFDRGRVRDIVNGDI